MVAVLKTVVRQRTGGSNPSSSVKKELVSDDDAGSYFVLETKRSLFSTIIEVPA